MYCSARPVLARLASLLLLGACGDSAPAGPPVPDRDERLETAQLIDASLGFEGFTIGRHIGEVVNTGKPDSYEYMDGGLKLAVYRKANIKVKVGDVAFSRTSLYFGRTDELQMYRLYENTDRITCDSAAGKFAELWGLGNPKGRSKLQWLGHEVMATWEHTTIRNRPTCFIEVRAVQMR